MEETNNHSLLSKIITLLVEIGLIVPLVGISKLILVMYLLNIPLNFKAILSMGLVTIPVYFGDRLFVDEEDGVNEQKSLRNEIIEKYYTIFFIFVIISLLSFWYITFVNLQLIGFLSVQIPLIIFGVYPYLKRFRYLDTIGIAVAWSSELILLAILFSSISLVNRNIIYIIVIMVIMKISETELSNIRDSRGDARVGNETLSVIYPIEVVKKVIILGTIVSLWGTAYLSDEIVVSIFAVLSSLSISLGILHTTPDNAREVITLDRVLKISLSIVILFIIFLG